ncbi:oligosaccharide flippase family protein [Cetobacterium sp. 2G large]|uniref:oligosaccharide flippase family protein n=1 Tax=Cetobacterium sp. 2G large TaxID=2759680 RepID=UPI00163C431A|nr:oligosaccharide flippase family protein [Cetobacterium sp. 2G large]MBC2852532.1 oligosaccharide flippase family protein [Cetobacterium sp. 2G large]
MKKNNLVHNTGYKFLLNIFRFTLPMLILPYIYRIMGTKNMGIINFSETIYSYFNIFIIMGVYEFGIREISKNQNDEEKKNKIFSNLMILMFINTVIGTIFYIILVKNYFYTSDIHKILMVLVIKLILIQLNVEWVNEGMEDYKFISIKTIICRSISLILMFLLIKKQSDLMIYIYLNIFFDLISNISSIIYIIRKNYVKLTFRTLELKKYFKIIVIIMIMTHSNILYFQFDKIILGIYSSEIEVAYYSLSERLIVIIASLMLTFNQVLFPRLSNYIVEKREKYEELLQNAIDYGILLVIPSIVGLITFSKEIVVLFAGKQFSESSKVFIYFTIYIIIYFYMNILSKQILFLFSKEKIIIFVTLILGVVNILLKLFLKTKLTAQNSILITLICQLLIIAIMYFYIRLKLKLKLKFLKKKYIYYLIYSLVFHFFCKLLLVKLNMSLIIYILIGVLCSVFIYIMLLLIFKDQIIYNLIKMIKGKWREEK